MSLSAARRVTRLLTACLRFGPSVDPADLASLIRRAGLELLSATGAPEAADPVAASVRPNALISFEDGKPYQRLTRHLAARGLTPAAYRRKWGPPEDYPMVCAAFARRCSQRRKRGRRSWGPAPPNG